MEKEGRACTKSFFSNEKHLKSVNCFPLTKQLKNDEKWWNVIFIVILLFFN